MDSPPRVGFAFFDVDETLLTFKSMFEFRRRLFQHDANGDACVAGERHAVFMAEAQTLSATLDRAEVNRWFYRSLQGQRETQIRRLAEVWFVELQQGLVPVFVTETVNLLEQLRGEGLVPVAVSGSAELFVAPFLRALNIVHRLCIRLEASPEGRLTGELLPPQTIGIGKQEAMREFLGLHGVAPADCCAVGDHHSDAAMLELVGHAVVVAGDAALEALAKQRQWPVLLPLCNRVNLAEWAMSACPP
jgi:HAD superfamily hydrolase (TIGR01490 family)